MAVIGVYSLFYAILNINSCHPIEHEWLRYGVEPTDKTHCNDKLLGTIPTYIAAFLNVLVDWILAIVPATVLWNLKMERKLKITTYAVLAIGSMCVTSATSSHVFTNSFKCLGCFHCANSVRSSVSHQPRLLVRIHRSWDLEYGRDWCRSLCFVPRHAQAAISQNQNRPSVVPSNGCICQERQPLISQQYTRKEQYPKSVPTGFARPLRHGEHHVRGEVLQIFQIGRFGCYSGKKGDISH